MARALQFLRQFVTEPIRNGSFALFVLRALQLVHQRTGGAWDEALRRAMVWFRPPVALPESWLLSDAEIAAVVGKVRQQGWSILPKRLSQAEVEQLRAFAFSCPAYVGQCANRVSVDPALPVQPHPRYEWLAGELVTQPAIRQLIEDSTLHRIAQDYLGCRPILTSISMWMDGVFHGGYDAHDYHYDNDGPGFLKFFIYLTDVDSTTGAHNFIQGTQGRRKPARFRAGMRYERDDILEYFGRENEIVVTGPAGTILAEDTAGFHRGLDPEKSYRLLVQFQYSVVDIPHIEEFQGGIPRTTIARLDPAIARIARKHAKAG